MTSIRTHLIGRLLIISAVLFGAADILIWIALDRVLDANVEGSLLAKARARSSLISQNGQGIKIDWHGLEDPINLRGDVPDIVQLQDEHNHLLGNEPGPAILPPPLKNGVATWEEQLSDGITYNIAALKFHPHIDHDDPPKAGSTIPPSILIVATDRDALDPHAEMTLILGVATFVALLTIAALIFREVNRGLAPLDRFGQQVSEINAGTLAQRLEAGALPAEVVPIAEKLNDLLTRLSVSFERERRFSADLSHELRTPIAELRSTSEIMLRQRDLPPEAKQGFQDVLDAACQMEALVSSLLDLVRGDGHLSTRELGPVAIGEMMRAAWKPYQAMIEMKQLKVSFDVTDATAFSHPRLLRSVFDNLFANAIEYTPLAGSIAISLTQSGDEIGIVIQNTAHHVNAEDLPHFFDQFWRKDKVRRASGHMGLGLSLTKMLCERLNIALAATMPASDTISFRLTIPTASASPHDPLPAWTGKA